MTNPIHRSECHAQKNQKKSRLPEKSGPPSKIKLRKHLNADALMSAFAIFSLKEPSLLQFDERRKEDAECQNLKSIYGIRNIPSDSRMRAVMK